MRGNSMERRKVRYVIQGDPIAWKRARLGNSCRFYDPQKHEKLCWGLSLSNQHNNQPLFEGPIELNIIFFMPIAKTSHKRTLTLYRTPHFIRPDLDNLVKFIKDVASNGVLYKDDCIVTSIHCQKVYADEQGPRTELIITELD